MQMNRRAFLGTTFAAGAAAAMRGFGACSCGCGCGCGCGKPTQVAVQLYSIRKYIDKVGLAQALKDVAKIGYKGVEFAGYYGNDAKTLKKMLDDAGLVACGTHVGRGEFSPEKIKATCEFNLGYGNNLIICPGGGNFPPGCSWSTGQGGEPCKPSQEIDDFTKKLVELYNKAAVDATKLGVKIGLHNHTWEHAIFMQDGTSFWDYFFTNTDKAVCMEQDVGWTTCAGDMIKGVNPMVQYKKYPHRSPTLHAKENGMGKGVKKFDAILGQPGCDENGKRCATPVDWDALFPVTDADGVEWYVVECERHFDDINGAVIPSFNFLKSKGRV